ncbi:hypothetical protein ACFL2Q_00790, partial [Thermodesulfobacteriota bacterium]
MGIDIAFDSDEGPGIQEEVLLEYLIARGEELLWTNPPGHGGFWWTLVGILTSQNGSLGDRLRAIRETANRSSLLETLLLLREVRKQGPDDLLPAAGNVSEDRSLLDEKVYKTILRFVWKEGRKQINSEGFEFLNVW